MLLLCEYIFFLLMNIIDAKFLFIFMASYTFVYVVHSDSQDINEHIQCLFLF